MADIQCLSSDKGYDYLVVRMTNLDTTWTDGRRTVYWYTVVANNYTSFYDVPDNDWIYRGHSYLYVNPDNDTQGEHPIESLESGTKYYIKAHVSADNTGENFGPFYGTATTLSSSSGGGDSGEPYLPTPKICQPGEICGYTSSGTAIASSCGYIGTSPTHAISPIIYDVGDYVDYVQYQCRKINQTSWEYDGTISDYYRDEGFYNFTIKNLDYCETYQVRARTYYNGNSSSWSEICNFETGGVWTNGLYSQPWDSDSYQIKTLFQKTVVDDFLQDTSIKIRICFQLLYDGSKYDEWYYSLDTSIFSGEQGVNYVLIHTIPSDKGVGTYKLRITLETTKNGQIYMPVKYDKNGCTELASSKSWTVTTVSKPTKWEWTQIYELSNGGTETICADAYIPIDENGVHPCTAEEWKKFAEKINEVRVWARNDLGLAVGGGDIDTSWIVAGADFKTHYNIAVNAIKQIPGVGGDLQEIASGDELTSHLFTFIASELNAAITNL